MQPCIIKRAIGQESCAAHFQKRAGNTGKCTCTTAPPVLSRSAPIAGVQWCSPKKRKVQLAALFDRFQKKNKKKRTRTHEFIASCWQRYQITFSRSTLVLSVRAAWASDAIEIDVFCSHYFLKKKSKKRRIL